jgi:hypothetical protein
MTVSIKASTPAELDRRRFAEVLDVLVFDRQVEIDGVNFAINPFTAPSGGAGSS